MVTMGPITFKLPLLTDAVQSVRDLASLFTEIPCDFVEGLDSEVARDFCHRGVSGDDCLDLLFREPINLTASGANKVESFEFQPSDGYLELFTAVAAHRQAHVFFRHGWPLVSVGCVTTPTVAEAEGESILLGGGR